MNCHDNKNNNKSHGPLKHILHMVICCGVPLLIVAALPFLKLSTALKATISGIAPFICPIMMVLMIPMMLKGMGQKNSNDKQVGDKSSVVKANNEQNSME